MAGAGVPTDLRELNSCPLVRMAVTGKGTRELVGLGALAPSALGPSPWDALGLSWRSILPSEEQRHLNGSRFLDSGGNCLGI